MGLNGRNLDLRLALLLRGAWSVCVAHTETR
jgi:hypothetical protein